MRNEKFEYYAAGTRVAARQLPSSWCGLVLKILVLEGGVEAYVWALAKAMPNDVKHATSYRCMLIAY